MSGAQRTDGSEIVDPVCSMVVAADSLRRFRYEGEEYRFCCDRCLERFKAEPQRFLADEKPLAKAEAGTLWVCPMCPEVESPVPVPCPGCGMALEPKVPTLDEDDGELRDMSRRLLLGIALVVPLLLLAMGPMLGLTLPGWLSPRLAGSLQALLATPVVLFCGAPFFARGLASLRRGRPNMFTLVSLGTGVAWAFSLLALLGPGLFPAAALEFDGSVALYFESAAVIVVLVLFGQVLELRARRETGAALRALLRLAPSTARRIEESGEEVDVPIESVVLGDRLRVRPGESLPVDGLVDEGAGAVDESMVTGEAHPVTKRPGDAVTAGTLNGNGTLVIRATAVGEATLLARILRIVAEAQRSRAPVERMVDQVAAWFVPGVVLVALGAFAAWFLFGPDPRLAHALLAAVSVLIVACPCALGLATPMSIMVATGRAAGLGILFRDAASIERLRDVDTVVFDKTGTLTEGRPRLVAVESVDGWDEDTILRLVASLEAGSEHPLASAIIKGSSLRQFSLSEAESFEVIPGQGICGTLEGHSLLVGSAALLEARSVSSACLQSGADAHRGAGRTVVHVAIDGEAVASLVVADPIKASTKEAIEQLSKLGLRLIMLTGDAQATGRFVAEQLGLSEVIAEVPPDEKADTIRDLRSSGAVVAMAGDGINDAPALALADVGLAMGTGTDIAIETANVTLVQGDLRSIARAIELSRATMANIRQNLFFAFVYNALGVPIAAGALYPLFGWLLSPMLAAAAMSLSSVSVIANALRLRGGSGDVPAVAMADGRGQTL